MSLKKPKKQNIPKRIPNFIYRTKKSRRKMFKKQKPEGGRSSVSSWSSWLSLFGYSTCIHSRGSSTNSTANSTLCLGTPRVYTPEVALPTPQLIVHYV